MKLFVTGGTGFVGSHFLRIALEEGHQVNALRRSPPGKNESAHPHLSWTIGDLASVSSELFQDCEALVHFAAHSSHYPYDSLENCLQTNLHDTLACFETAREAGVRRFYVAGSCFEYGRSAERFGRIPPTAPLEPTNSYATSKAAASVALLGWASIHQTELLIGRIFQVFGQGEPENRFWPDLKDAALAGADFPMTAGEQIRDFTPVEFVGRWFVNALEDEDLPPGRPVVRHVGTGKPQTLRQFAEDWWKRLGATGQLIPGAQPYRDGEVMRYVPEIDHA